MADFGGVRPGVHSAQPIEKSYRILLILSNCFGDSFASNAGAVAFRPIVLSLGADGVFSS